MTIFDLQKIKFSHRYVKMPSNFALSTVLLVLKCNAEELSEIFRRYDSLMAEADATGKPRYYPLPTNGPVLFILLRSIPDLNSGDKGELWTTIRSYSEENRKRYESYIGKRVDCSLTTPAIVQEVNAGLKMDVGQVEEVVEARMDSGINTKPRGFKV